MITLKHNAPVVIGPILTSLDALQPEGDIIKLIKTQTGQLLMPIMKDRIHTNGIATDGSAIGSTLVVTGKLRDGLTVLAEGIGFSDETLAARTAMLENKYVKTIWQPTAEEEQQAIQLAQNFIDDAFSGK